ncbi:YigZ family protein [Paraferrimonas sedimenticola]|uniref:YigZ family protein n=1 Tax=Paraferrimonas sedimenticola TaxID=375674 RepID=A0AA37W098_9GAMM|nr:YigZ family protein [Paraferrimonas sedimenticola]GLP97689.1 YigZ family protein [Paraferrimonas sedimenticola]
MSDFRVASEALEFEETINKSRFITLLEPFTIGDDLKQRLARAKARYPGASHYCWAYLAGAPSDTVNMGYSDDGEPSGTAGRPMLAVLQGAQVGQLLAIVVRYYGGVKLGTGGLARAYASGIKQAIPNLPTHVFRQLIESELRVDYADAQTITHELKACEGELLSSDYGAQVIIKFALPENQLDKFSRQVNNLTQGRVRPHFEHKG